MKLNNLKNQIFIIIILVLILIMSISLFLPDFTKGFSLISEILQLIFSLITLIIAVNIYDKFGINKKLAENRTDILIQLISNLKDLGFRTIIKTSDSSFSTWFESSKNITKNLDNLTIEQLNTKLIFRINDQHQIQEKLKKFVQNPILPKSIKEKLEFLKPISGEVIEFKNINNKTGLYFYINDVEKIEMDGWINNPKALTLKEFVLNYRDLYLEIENWIKNHTDLIDELNI